IWPPPLISISVTVALFVIQSGPALKAFLISHSSECLRLVKVPGGKGSVADERSSAKACVEETNMQIVMYLRTSFISRLLKSFRENGLNLLRKSRQNSRFGQQIDLLIFHG